MTILCKILILIYVTLFHVVVVSFSLETLMKHLYGKHGPDAWLRLHKRRFLQPHALHPVLCFESSTERVTSTMTNNSTPSSNDVPHDDIQLQDEQVEEKETEPRMDAVPSSKNSQDGKTASSSKTELSGQRLTVWNDGYAEGMNRAEKDSKRNFRQTKTQFEQTLQDFCRKYLLMPDIRSSEAQSLSIGYNEVREICKDGYQIGYNSEMDFEQEGFFLSEELGPIYAQAYTDKENDGRREDDLLDEKAKVLQALRRAFDSKKTSDYQTVADYIQKYLIAYESYKVQSFRP